MIQSTPRRLFRKFLGKFIIPKVQFSYSQFGEDLIIAYFFYQLGIHKVTYLDIGANEARFISNTYYFYERGGRGVLIEPNPYLYKKLKARRPRDIVLNSGIGFSNTDEADFYVFPNYANGLSTFSLKTANYIQNTGMKGIGKIPVKAVIKMQLLSINYILKKYFSDKAPDFISIDVEGLDFQILKSFDFERYGPKVICVETFVTDEDSPNGYKNVELIDFLLSQNYRVYADTRINTIFCKSELI